MEKIKIKYLSDKIERLRYIDGKSDWIDLRAAERVELKKGEFQLIPLGVAMQLPQGFEAHIVPRSSTFKNFGIIQTNHCGIVDESYCGNNDQWFMPAFALRDTVIEVNDRICQFRIFAHQPTLTFAETDDLGNEDRGTRLDRKAIKTVDFCGQSGQIGHLVDTHWTPKRRGVDTPADTEKSDFPNGKSLFCFGGLLLCFVSKF